MDACMHAESSEFSCTPYLWKAACLMAAWVKKCDVACGYGWDAWHENSSSGELLFRNQVDIILFVLSCLVRNHPCVSHLVKLSSIPKVLIRGVCSETKLW